MDFNDYDQALKQAANEMKVALAEFNVAQSRVADLQKKMAALHILRSLAKPESEMSAAERQDIEHSKQLIEAVTKPADSIRRIFVAAPGHAWTTKEIREELHRSGYDLTQHSNIGSTIDAVCKRLAEQEFVSQTKKNGRNAWVRKDLSNT